MSPSLALQAAIRTRLVADPAVVALVPAADITDRHGRPVRYPSINFGEGREYPLGAVKRDSARVVLDLHIWTDTPGTRGSKIITDAVRLALRDAPWTAEGHVMMDLVFSSARHMPDPASADVTHGVISFEAFMLEAEHNVEQPAPPDDDDEDSYDPNYDPGDLTLIFENKLI